MNEIVRRIAITLVGLLGVAGAGIAQADAVRRDQAPSIAELISEGRLDDLERLIEGGVPPEAGLMPAVRFDSVEALRRVLELGADPNGLAASRALLRARRQGVERAGQMLAAAGADLEGTDPYGRTLLILAIQEESISRVKDIIQEGADVNARSNVGITALMEAVFSGQLRKVKLLLASGADLAGEDRDGWTALDWAVWREEVDCLRYLLARDADPDHVDRLGWSALHRASALGNPVVVNELLAAGAAPNLRTPTVGPALIRAVIGGEPEVVRQLLAFGADRRISFFGRTPFDLARALGRADLARLLRPRRRAR